MTQQEEAQRLSAANLGDHLAMTTFEAFNLLSSHPHLSAVAMVSSVVARLYVGIRNNHSKEAADTFLNECFSSIQKTLSANVEGLEVGFMIAQKDAEKPERAKARKKKC